jgi:hypothetical protein
MEESGTLVLPVAPAEDPRPHSLWQRMSLLCVVFAAFITICFPAGCAKPSIEGETRNFNGAAEKSKKYQDLYPAFRTVLAADAEKAAKMFKEGEGMGGEGGIKKMQEANRSFGTVLSKLEGIEPMEEKIRGELSALDKLGEKGFEAPSVNRRTVRKDMDRAFENVQWALKGSSVENETQALALVSRQVTTLEEVEAPIKRALDYAQGEEKKKSDADKAKAGGGKDTKDSKPKDKKK